ncbi:MAG: histone deacetylase family protein [Isosphaeraceae bacterium]|nr:histone deacetylase family protein [Isosphaeraceae bacterium]
MKIIYSPRHQRHATNLRIPGCPFEYNEVPARAEVIREAVLKAGLGPLQGPEDHGLAPILAVHDAAFVEYLKTAYQITRSRYEGTHPVLADTYAVRLGRHRPAGAAGLVGYYAFDIACPILEGTWTAAYQSAQVALTAAEFVRQGEPTAYALCRPPGHHASTNLHGGFCYLNNAAIAARALQGKTQDRVAIIDIDYHHGNGTQEIFYRDPTVLVCSLHADPDADYPYYWGGADERGEGPAVGCNRNWPLPLGTDDDRYLSALDEALGVVHAFRPRYLVVSVGFDLMQDDPVPLGEGFRISPHGLHMIGHLLASLDLPTVLVQEGGYHVPRLGEYATIFLKEFA